MSNAIIIFADGSKQMAHNLDDNHFRWYESKLASYEEVVSAFSEGITIRDSFEPRGLVEAQNIRTELIAQKTSLENDILIIKAYVEDFIEREKQCLLFKLAKKEIEVKLVEINAYISKRNIRRSEIQTYGENARTLQYTEAQARKLQIEQEKTERLKLQVQMLGGMTPEQHFEIARLKEERLAKDQADSNREYSGKLQKENLQLRMQLVEAQADVIRLQKILIEQLGINPNPVDLSSKE